MSQVQEIQDFLAGPQGAIAIAALVLALGLIVIAKYLLRAGGIGTPKRVAAKRKQSQTPTVASTKVSVSSTEAAGQIVDDDDGGKLTRRTRRSPAMRSTCLGVQE
ncbi:hypothetical protein Vretimale_104 [Volvox reticuliferus]|uniref:Uncharacterized protein n=1 Tax=Volvox reticuliferus TaxID=1737510 RepID=A0A8J4D6J7_9CHLO|nr:hypothetical protein Vretimale_104 [Volvox reticuliferus]